MTTEESKIQKENYRLLANFLGWHHLPITENQVNGGWYYNDKWLSNYKNSNYINRKTQDLNFSSDWNKLLKVVEKIESIRHQKYGRFIVTISEDTCLIRSTNITKNDIYSKLYVSRNNKIRAVYESCLLFVKFWNNLNK